MIHESIGRRPNSAMFPENTPTSGCPSPHRIMSMFHYHWDTRIWPYTHKSRVFDKVSPAKTFECWQSSGGGIGITKRKTQFYFLRSIMIVIMIVTVSRPLMR